MILTAKQMFESTEQALKSDVALDHLCQYFSSFAKDGCVSATISTEGLAKLIGEKRMKYWHRIVQELKELGYGVLYNQLEDEYMFSWKKEEETDIS